MIRILLILASLTSLAWPVTRTHQELIDLAGRKGDITHLYDLYKRADWITPGEFGGLSAAVTAIGSAQKTLLVADTITLTANVTIPSNIALMVVPGGYFTGAFTLTVNGAFIAGQYKLFDSTITLAGQPRLTEIFPEWWGAAGDGVANDAPEIQACMNFVSANYALGDGESPQIYLSRNYKCDTTLTIPDRVDLVGKSHAAGNLSRNTARLGFTSLGANTKAIVLGRDITLRGLVISGPGEDSAGTYGLYGGLIYQENHGFNCRISGVTLEDFETGIIFSGWLNIIEQSNVDDCKTGIILQHAANHTVIRNSIIEPGPGFPKIGIHIKFNVDRGPEGVYISENDIEGNYYGIVVESGKGVLISSNRFEICNGGFIEVRGRNAASDSSLTVDIHHNWLLDYGSGASSSSRFGIKVSAGKVTVDDNEISRFDPVEDEGLRYGIAFDTSGILIHCLIGKNRIKAFQAIQDVSTTALREKINSRFQQTFSYEWDLADGTVEFYPQIQTPTGYSAVYSFRKLRSFVLTGLDALVGEINLGHRSASTDLVAYLDTFEPSAVTQYTVDYAGDSHWTTAGKTFATLSDTQALTLRAEAGAATSGKVLLALTVDEFQW
jgi:hypothetical protein